MRVVMASHNNDGHPIEQANIIGARWFAYVKKNEELDSIKIVSTRQLTRLSSFIAWNVNKYEFPQLNVSY